MRIYRDIIKSAWYMLWHYAWLWPFGLLAALAGNGGEYGSIVSAVDRISQQGNLLAGIRAAVMSDKITALSQGISQSLNIAPASIVATLFLLVVAVLLMVWLVIVAQAALIKSASDLDAGQTVGFTSSAIEANKKFWPIFLLNLLARFVTWLLLAIAVLPFLISYLARGGSAEFDSLIIISFLIFVPLALIISFIIKYAVIAVVIDKKEWWQALEHAVNLFFRNWLTSLEMAAILFGVNILISAVVYSLIANSLLTAPLAIALKGLNLATVLRFIPQLLLLIAVGAWFSTFQYAAWTILYRRLNQIQIIPKLIRVADDIPNYIENWFKTTPKSLPKPRKAQKK